MEFYTQFKRPKDAPEINTGEDICEKTGYVPANVIIENMIYAGQRLDLARSDMYDFKDEEDIDHDYIDPTRAPGFDLADASAIGMQVSSKLSEQRKLFEEEKRIREEDEKKQYKLFQEEQEKKKKEIKEGKE